MKKHFQFSLTLLNEINKFYPCEQPIATDQDLKLSLEQTTIKPSIALAIVPGPKRFVRTLPLYWKKTGLSHFENMLCLFPRLKKYHLWCPKLCMFTLKHLKVLHSSLISWCSHGELTFLPKDLEYVSWVIVIQYNFSWFLILQKSDSNEKIHYVSTILVLCLINTIINFHFCRLIKRVN